MDPVHYDVFLSHNSKDKPTVERIAVKLKQAGLEPWLDVWSLTPGGRWQEEIAAGLREARSFALFVGPNGIGDWVREELELAKDRAAKDRSFRLFPVLLPGLPDPFDAATLPPFVSTHTWVDLRKGFEEAVRFQPLINAVKGIPLGPAAPIAPNADVCPYRGLQSFDEAHAEFFFGREADVQRLLERLKGTRFLGVVGASGSGKSSLVRAGLIPALRNGRLPESNAWDVAVFTPGAHPLTALAAQLTRLAPAVPMGATLDQLGADARTLHLATALALADRTAATRLVFVVDQFEEIFTLCRDESERARFLENLLYAAGIPDGRCVVVLTMRADFYPRCAAYPDLAARLATQQYLVSPLDDEGLRRAVVEPAWRVGLQFEDGLVETILADVARQPGGLPLLEHALLELWERRRGTVLTLEGYRETGGVAGAIAKRADTIYASFSPEQQAIARRVMLRLTQPGEGTEDTRRRATLDELVTDSGEQEAVEAAVGALVDARLLMTTADEGGATWVDVSHEALIRGWPRLRGWIEEDRAGLRVHRRLTEAAQEWQRLGRDEGALYRGSRLAEAMELRDRAGAALNEQERAFLAAAADLRDREVAERETARRARERLQRRIAAGLAAGLLVALVLAVFAWDQRDEARAGKEEAERQAGLALANGQTAEARGTETDQALQTAESDRAVAERESTAAAAERARADAARQTAEAEQARAEQEAAEAERARKDALARQLALQAIYGADDPRLSLLLAAEANRLNPDSIEGRQALLRSFALLPAQLSVFLESKHPKMLDDVAFSPDGASLFVASADGAVYRYDLTTRTRHDTGLAGIPGFAGAAYPTDLSPDGARFATGADNHMIVVSDVTTGAEVVALPGPEEGLSYLVFSRDGAVLAAGGFDGRVALSDAATGAAIGAPLIGHGDDVAAIAFGPRSTLLASGAADGTLFLWDRASGNAVATSLPVQTGGVRALAFNYDGSLLAVADGESTITLFEVASALAVGPPLDAERAVTALAFTPSGVGLVAAGGEGTVGVWDVASGNESVVPAGGQGVVIADLAFGPDGTTMATAGFSFSNAFAMGAVVDGSVALWDVSRRVRFGEVLGYQGRVVSAAAFAPDGAALAAGSYDGVLAIWDAAVEPPRREPAVVYTASIRALVYRPDGAALAVGSIDWTEGTLEAEVTTGTIQFLDPVTGADLRPSLASPIGRLTSLAYSPDGALLAIGGDGVVLVWDLAADAPRGAPLALTGDVRSLSFTPDGTALVAHDEGGVTVWDVAGGTVRAALPQSTPDEIIAIAVGPDGATVAVAGENGSIRLWDVATQTERVGPSNGEGVAFLAYSPDGTLIAAVGRRFGAIGLIDGATLTDLGALSTSSYSSILFAPDGRYLVAIGGDGVISLIAVDLAAWQSEACAVANRNLTVDEWTRYLGEETYQKTCRDLPGPSDVVAAGSPAAAGDES